MPALIKRALQKQQFFYGMFTLSLSDKKSSNSTPKYTNKAEYIIKLWLALQARKIVNIQ